MKKISVLIAVFLFSTIWCAFAGIACDTIQIAGGWKIQPAVSPDQIPDPGSWGTDHMMGWKKDRSCGENTPWAGLSHDSVHCLWYQKTVFIPEEWKGQRVRINFRRVEGDGILFLNGKRISELLRPGGEVELTGNVIFGKENVLRVFITRDYTGISRGFEADPLRFQIRKEIPVAQWPMGITAPVTLASRPSQFLSDVFCIPSFRKKELSIQAEINGTGPEKGYHIEGEIVDQEGRKVLTMKGKALKLAGEKTVCEVTEPWPDAICWELERPYLYRARVRLMQGNKVIDQYKDVSFGFREIWTEGNKLYMNGHLSRWRLTDIYGTNRFGLSLYRMIGYNVGQIQPHSNLWWSENSEIPLLDEELLKEMDRMGMGCTIPAPSVAKVRSALVNDRKAEEDYRREVEYYCRLYRNHPSVFAWVVGMNSANPRSNIWPWSMGKRDSVYMNQGKVIDFACSIVKQSDPTRLVFSHADGSVGDISSANVYLNFVPLQEREEWPMEWAQHGNMPYSAVEFGPPYWHNYWKGNQFLLTEYLSMYLGDEAYTGEGCNGLRRTVENSLRQDGSTWEQLDFREYPRFWEFQELFTRNTNRAWRTWGVNAGWLYWLLEGYGDPPGPKTRFTHRYRSFTAPLTKKPEWVNPRFEIFKQANQPLLAYIAGYPVHTDKTHLFFSDEIIRKQIAVVWDGSEPRTLSASWSFKQNGSELQKGEEAVSLAAGEIRMLPLKFQAPVVRERTSAMLVLQLKEANEVVAADTFLLDIFPKFEKIQTKMRVAVYDPMNRSVPWIKNLGIDPVPWERGMSPRSIDMLVIGREALLPGDRLPYDESDIAGGLKVIILEQQPGIWEGMGFQVIETMPRYTFIRDIRSPLVSGLTPDDFINWRGAPDLLPEGKPARSYDSPRAPKWTNTHAVASVVLKTPEIVGFTPILQAEFDMAYSSLLEWQYGKGKVTFCSLDLTNRVGEDPAATMLAANLLKAQLNPVIPSRHVFYVGNDRDLQLLSGLGLQVEQGDYASDPRNSILVIGQDGHRVSSPPVRRFISKGGIVFCLPQPAGYLSAEGFHVNPKELVQVPLTGNQSLLRGIGPGLLRWRDVLYVDAFAADGQPANCSVLCNGIALEKQEREGKVVYLQIAPGSLAGRYPDSEEKTEAVQLSVIRLHQLVAQFLTNLGACVAKPVANRLTQVGRQQSFRNLTSWKILGPYHTDTKSGRSAVETLFPAQQDAVEGAENPNITYKRADGIILDWRREVSPDQNGFVDLAKFFGGKDENAVVYLTKNIFSQQNQKVTIRLGVDFWMEAWLNGKSILKVTQTHSKGENEFILNVPLQKGENILTLKVASGTGGYGFWANMSDLAEGSGTVQENVSFYHPLDKDFDPYKFAYW